MHLQDSEQLTLQQDVEVFFLPFSFLASEQRSAQDWEIHVATTLEYFVREDVDSRDGCNNAVIEQMISCSEK